MIDEKERFERLIAQFEMPEPAMLRLLGLRARKERRKRISAGSAGIAVFVAAIWIVTTGGPFSQSDVDPEGSTSIQPTPSDSVAPEDQPDDYGFLIPPAGAAVSTPVEGELIAEAYVGIAGHLRVYADGRVLSAESSGAIIFERLLSPEGVELVRQVLGERVHLGYEPGDVLESLLGASPGIHSGAPQSAWEDREGKPWVPARYAFSFRHLGRLETVLNQLPASAQALLRGSDPVAWHPRWLEVTPEQARSLEEILSEAFSSPTEIHLSGWKVGVWSLRDGDDDQIIIRPLFPDGRPLFSPGY